MSFLGGTVAFCSPARALLVLIVGSFYSSLSESLASQVLGSDDPISRVLTLLQDLSQQLAKEAEEDEDVNDKMVCWCEKNDKSTTLSIADNNQLASDLRTTIETTAANSARLEQEIKYNQEDLTKSQQSLDTATALRERQAAEFNAEEKEMIQSISALDAAIVILSKHNGGQGGALIDRTAAIKQSIEVASSLMQKHHTLLQDVITPQQRRSISVLLTSSGVERQPTFRPYSAQSGEIFGVLGQMKVTFQSNLAESQKEEVANANAFAALKAAKQAEISATQSAIDQKKAQFADANEKNAQAKQDLEDTQLMLVNDNGFLLTVQEKCNLSATEYQTRAALRQEEQTTVAEAISILTSDLAQQSFSTTFGAVMFLQFGSRRMRDATYASDSKNQVTREAAAALLRNVAMQTGSNRMAALARSAKLDAFTAVKAAIDKMIGELKVEGTDDMKHRDDCIANFHENDLLTQREGQTKIGLEAKVDSLTTTMTDLTSAIAGLQNEIGDLKVQIKRRGEDREKENKDFQLVLADHRQSQQLLAKAIAVIKSVYAKRQAVATANFIQVQAHSKRQGFLSRQRQAPTYRIVDAPAGFTASNRTAVSGGLLALLAQISDDAKAMEMQVLKDENDSQTSYEEFVKSTNVEITAKATTIITKTGEKAKAESDLTTSKDDLKNSVIELSQLADTAQSLHLSCDFLMKNFDVRQAARDEEIEALQQAKAVLSGMKLD